MSGCPICQSSDMLEIDYRDHVPIGQNLVFETREAALACATGILDIRRCKDCGFAWNGAFDPELLVYDATYDNDQNFSARFRRHTDHIATTIVDALPTEGQLNIVEVGCGQGKFIATLADKLGARLAGAIGFDPAWKGDGSRLPPNTEVKGEYFTGSSFDTTDIVPDVAVSRHVIEHVPDPIAFLTAIRAALPAGAPVFIETPDIDWVLRNGVFFDLNYEHCSLFTPHSLKLALEKTGFAVDRVDHVFEDQYMLAVARATDDKIEPDRIAQQDDLGYRVKRDRFLGRFAALVDERGASGPVALWGGASKGVTLCLMLPDASERICCAIDINEGKQGAFLPTTGISIVSPRDAAARGVKTSVVVNPAYLDEIERLCDDSGLPFEHISIDAIQG